MAAIEIAIPPKPGYVAVARLALGSLARDAGADEELVDEMKIAISEALTNAVMAQEEGSPTDMPLSIRWGVEGGVVDVCITTPSGEGDDLRDVDTQGFSTRSAMSEALLRSLADDYSVSESEGRSEIHLRFALARSPDG